MTINCNRLCGVRYVNGLLLVLPTERMGVYGLMEYIRNHPYRDRVAPRIDLVQEAEQARKRSGKDKALLLCDYAAVVRVLENAILKSQQPKLCEYYGCDTRLLAKQVKLFIQFLCSIGVEPVFYADGPMDDKDCKFEEKKKRQVQKSDRIREWEENVKTKGSYKPKENTPHPLCYPVCDRVLKELKVKCLVANCEADVVLIDHCKSSRNALGILSQDTDIAIADGCHFLPLEFVNFEAVIEFQKEDIKLRDGIKSLPCRYTSRVILSERLEVHYDDMPWFAMLCGNDYTRPFVKKVRQILGIPIRSSAKQVAEWFHSSRAPQREIRRIREMKGFEEACQFSMDLYSGVVEYDKPVDMSTQMLSPVFQSIKKGTYWQQPVADAPTLRLPLPYTVSQPIRSTVYALYACRTVKEYGYHPTKSADSSRDIPCITVQGHMNLSEARKGLQSCNFSVRAVALHHFVNTPLYQLGFNNKRIIELKQSAPTHLPPDITEQEVLRGVIAVSTLAHLASNKEMKWRDNEVQACLLALAATSAGVQGNVDIGQPDPDGPFLRAVSLSATITATLLSLYYVVELLDLDKFAPKPSDIFCSSVFVPAYMAVMQAQEIPALAFMLRAVASPHTTELMECIRTMVSTHGKPELTVRSTLIATVRSYINLVKELKAYMGSDR